MALGEACGGNRAGGARARRTIRHLASPSPVTSSIGPRARLCGRRAIRQTRDHRGDQVSDLAAQHPSPHLATCPQPDVEEWLASGPTTRSKIRNLLAWAKKTRLNRSVHITHQQAPPSRSLTQEQRLAWLRELLTGDSETLAYRVAGTLLLLFAQPLTRIAALPTSAIAITDNHVHIWLGKEPIPVPQPFADMLINHTGSRPNLRAAGGMGASRWLFPSVQPGRHLLPTSDQGKARTAGHRSARRTKHHLAKPRCRRTTTGGRRTTRLQLHHNPAPR